jgi:DNA-binding NtrC family response regulator
MRKIPLLMITSRDEDLGELTALLQTTLWDVNRLTHLEDADAALKAASVPILLIDREAAGACWQTALKRLVGMRRSASVILLSNVSDAYLWDEVVKQGGFDLLTRPFKKDKVLSMFLFAYAHCRAPWPKRVS